MKNPHPTALRKAIKDYKTHCKSRDKMASNSDKAQTKLACKIKILQEQLAEESAHKTKLLARYKIGIENYTLSIMTEANAAGLNAAAKSLRIQRLERRMIVLNR